MDVLRASLRVLLATVAGFCFTMLVICAWYTWRDAAAQGWDELGMAWLRLDLWSRAWEIKEALAGAALTCALAVLAETTRRSRLLPLRVLRWGERTAAHPLTVIALAALAFGLPRAAASLTQPEAPEGAPNLVYVMVDTWRADHVGWLGYERPVTPKLDELVRSGLVFERAVSVAGWTKPAVATQLTGHLPSTHQAVSQPVPGLQVHGTQLPPWMVTWIEVLRSRGWQTGMFSNNPNILPSHGFDQGAGHFVDYVNHPERRGSPEDPDGFDPGRSEHMLPEVRTWIDAQADTGRPFAAYVHIMDPHYPYVAPEPFAGTFDDTGLDFQLTGIVCGEYMSGEKDFDTITPAMLKRINAIYDEEILYVDTYLAPFLERLRADHPNTVIVLISDHGEEFLEHGLLGHGQSVYSELVNVPLVVWAPGLDAGRIPHQVRTYDVVPTLYELTGVGTEMAGSLPGASLVEPIAGHRLALMESGGDERPPWHWRAVSDGRWKYIERLENRPDQTEGPIYVLEPVREADGFPYRLYYDLASDPNEQSDLFDQRKGEARTLRARADEQLEAERWYGTDHIFEFGTSAELGASQEMLEALGYAEKDK